MTELQTLKNELMASATERILAAAGVLTISAASLYVWFFNPTTQGLFPVCPLLSTTGIACPGCGLTRGFHALFHGDILTALGYNALLPVYAAVFGYFFIGMLLVAVRGRGISIKAFHPLAVWGFLIVSVAFAVLRNLPFYPFSLLYP